MAKAATRTTSDLPVNYREQLMADAQAIADKIAAPTGDRVRYEGNRMLIAPDGTEGETMEVVVLDIMSSNMFYDRPYDRDNPSPPACYAIGPSPTTLTPSDKSPDRQADTCATCPMNQFGSALTGKGKACKNTRLLAVVPVNQMENAVDNIWIMSIPPSSIKSFDSFVHKLAMTHGISPIGVVSEVTLDQKETFASPRFKSIRPLTDEELAHVMPLKTEALQRLAIEPDVSTYEPPKSRARR